MNFTSQKGRPQKSLDGFIYRFDKSLKNGVESWRCGKKLCRGRIYIVNGKVDNREEHNHEPNLVESEVKQYLSSIREKAATTAEAAKDLIEQDLAALSPEALVKLPKFASTQRMIERKRKSNRDALNSGDAKEARTQSIQTKRSYSLSASSTLEKAEHPIPEPSSSTEDQAVIEQMDPSETESPTRKRKRFDSSGLKNKKRTGEIEELPKVNVKEADCDDLFLASLSKEFKQIKNEETKLDLKILILQLVRSAIHGSRVQSTIDDYQDDVIEPTDL